MNGPCVFLYTVFFIDVSETALLLTIPWGQVSF